MRRNRDLKRIADAWSAKQAEQRRHAEAAAEITARRRAWVRSVWRSRETLAAIAVVAMIPVVIGVHLIGWRWGERAAIASIEAGAFDARYADVQPFIEWARANPELARQVVERSSDVGTALQAWDASAETGPAHVFLRAAWQEWGQDRWPYPCVGRPEERELYGSRITVCSVFVPGQPLISRQR